MADRTSPPLDLLVVEDDPAQRAALAELLRDSAFAASFVSTAAEALASVATRLPDLTIVDLGLPDRDGADLTRELTRTYPGLPVVVVTAAATRKRVLEALGAGARGYMVKEDLARLESALLDALAGRLLVSGAVARFVLDQVAHSPTPDLTRREREVLSLLARGLSYEEAAAQLGVSLNTVRSHVRSAYDKLGASTKAEAVALALRSGQLDG